MNELDQNIKEIDKIFQTISDSTVMKLSTKEKISLFDTLLTISNKIYIFYNIDDCLSQYQKKTIQTYWQNHFPFESFDNQAYDNLQKKSLTGSQKIEQFMFYAYNQFKQYNGQDFIDNINERQFSIISKIFFRRNYKNSETKNQKKLIHLIITDKDPEFLNNSTVDTLTDIEGLNILHKSVAHDNYQLAQHILDQGVDPESKTKGQIRKYQKYATAFLKSLKMAQLLDSYQAPFFNENASDSSAIALLQDENKLSSDLKPLNQFIVEKTKQETGNPDIGALYCLKYFKNHPYQKYFKQYYALAQPNNLKHEFTYQDKKASLLEHMLFDCLSHNNIVDIKNTKYIASKKNSSVNQLTSNNNFSLLPYVCFIKQSNNTALDEKLVKASSELYSTFLNGNKKQNDYLNPEQFKQDIQFCDQFDFNQTMYISDSKSKNNLFHQNILLYFLYRNQKYVNKSDNNANLHTLFDFLLKNEKKHHQSINNIIKDNVDKKQNKNQHNYIFMYQTYEQENKTFRKGQNTFEFELLEEIKQTQDPNIKKKYFDLNTLIYTNSLLINQFFVTHQSDQIKQKYTVKGIVECFKDEDINDVKKQTNLAYLKKIYNKTAEQNQIHPSFNEVFRLMENKQLKKQTSDHFSDTFQNNNIKRKNKML